jgi:hypothetical protein
MNDDEVQDLLRDMRLKNDELEAERDRYKAALEFIADEDNYFGSETKDPHSVGDLMRIAREALADDRGKE